MLGYKWNQVRPFMLAQAGVFSLFILLILAFTLFFMDDVGIISSGMFLIVPFVVNLLLMSAEIFQLHANPGEYFTEITNILDVCRSLLFLAYCILVWTNTQFELMYSLWGLTVLVNLVRGISFFRVFKMTRYLIHLILEVVKDCSAFLIMFVYTTICSGFLFYILEARKDEEVNIFHSVASSYVLNLGDFSVDGYNAF